MATYVFTPVAVTGGATVRFDTASGSTTPATIYPLDYGQPIPGALLRAHTFSGNLPQIESDSAVLYQKTLDYRGVTVTATTTLNGVAQATGGGTDPRSQLDSVYETRASSRLSRFDTHRKRRDMVRLNAMSGLTVSGTITASTALRWPAQSFPAGSGTVMAFQVPELPSDWTAVDIELVFANGSAVAGSPQFRVDWITAEEGSALAQPSANVIRTVSVDATQYKVYRRWIIDQSVTPNKPAVMNVVRLGNVDGHAAPILLLEVRLRKRRDSVIAAYDGIWTFWHERLTTLSGKTYFGAIDTAGVAYAAAYDHSAKTTTRKDFATIGADDHNNPSVIITSTRAPVAVFCGHGSDNLVRYHVGTTPGDITTLGSQQTVTLSGTTTYAQVHPRETQNELHILVRGGGTSTWTYLRSTDWLATAPGNVRKLVNLTGQGYVQSRLAADGKTLRVMAWGHPSVLLASDHKLWYFTVDLATGNVYDQGAGSPIGNVQDGSSGAAIYDTTVRTPIYTAASGRTINGVDLSDATNVEFLLAEKELSDATTTTDQYLYGVLVNGQVTFRPILNSGGKFGYWDGGLYTAAGCFPIAAPGGTVYLGWREESSLWRLGKVVTADGGATWTTTVVDESDHPMVRPFPVFGGPNPYAIGYTELARYDDTNYTNYHANVRLR